jgi:hypothetical protein
MAIARYTDAYALEYCGGAIAFKEVDGTIMFIRLRNQAIALARRKNST